MCLQIHKIGCAGKTCFCKLGHILFVAIILEWYPDAVKVWGLLDKSGSIDCSIRGILTSTMYDIAIHYFGGLCLVFSKLRLEGEL